MTHPVTLKPGVWPGLAERLAEQGITLDQRGGQWLASSPAAQVIIDAYTEADALAWAKAARKGESLAIAKALRDRVVAAISAGEMAAWPIKRAEALAYAQSGDAAQAPLLSAEAEARGITLPAMLAKVQANAQAFAALEAAIGGADGRHRDALDALGSVQDVLAYDLTAGWPAV